MAYIKPEIGRKPHPLLGHYFGFVLNNSEIPSNKAVLKRYLALQLDAMQDPALCLAKELDTIRQLTSLKSLGE